MHRFTLCPRPAAGFPVLPPLRPFFWLALALLLLALLPGAPGRRGTSEGWSLLPRALAGDDGSSITDEEKQEAVDHHTERGWHAFRTGNYDEVLARMDRIERYAPDDPLADYLRVRVAMRRGRYSDALARATKALEKHPDHRGLRAARLELLMRLGRVDEVAQEARKILATSPKDPMAHSALGLALEERGHRKEAMAEHRAAIDAWNPNGPSEDLLWVARSAIQATWISTDPSDDLLGAVNRLLSRRVEAHPEDEDAVLMLADLFQADRGPTGQSRADKYYRQILKENPEVPLARVGLARKMLVFWHQDGAIQELQRALATNPNLVPALALLASIHVGNGDYEKAEKLLDRADDVDPNDRDARAVRAALLWIRGAKDEYGAVEKAAKDWDPTDGRFYVTISDLVGERQRRYDVAADFARRAVETDPNDPLGYVTLGEDLMNLGQTDEARKVFETSIGKSKGYKDVKRDNWLMVLDVLDRYRTTASKHFRIRMHPAETDVMAHYLPPLLERAWSTLSKKYGYTPKGPVLVDSFRRADDFSVRSIGVEGLPALGVCFGEVITLLGPTSRPVGSFSWAQTAWHEFTHTITLGESHGQVPRWLTEGLSVYEESVRRPDCSRLMQRELFDRYENHHLLKLGTINQAFRSADIGFGYFQGGLIADHLTESRGFDVIPKMLREFGQDKTTAEVFHDVLGIELGDYDAQFREYVGKIVGKFELVPRWDDESFHDFLRRTKQDPKDEEAWVRLGWAHLQRGRSIDAGAALAKAKALRPDDPEVVLLEGRLAQVNGRADLAAKAYQRYFGLGADDFEARMFLAKRAGATREGSDSKEEVKQLEAAKACFPFAVGKASPYLQLARLYQGAGEIDKAVKEEEAYIAVDGDNYGVRKELKSWYRDKKDWPAVVRLSAEMVDISPFGANQDAPPDFELHRDYAHALEALGRKDEALRELEVQALLLGMVDEPARREAGGVADLVELGGLYLERDRPLDALEQAIAALRLSPDDANARMLKSRAQEAAGYR